MMCYSIQSRYGIFVKDYGVLPFAKNMNKNIDKNKSRNLSGKYSQILVQAKQSATDVLENPSKMAIQTTAEATADLIGNNIE